MSVRPFQAGPAKEEWVVPWYVYLAAILLIGWAALVLTLVLSVWVSLEDFGPLFRRAMIPIGLELATGAGLLLHRRWGWVLGIATSVFLLEEGLRRAVFGGTDRESIVLFESGIHYFIPAIVLLVCLLPRRARRAYLGEKQFDVN
jgi:hypothetical protein